MTRKWSRKVTRFVFTMRISPSDYDELKADEKRLEHIESLSAILSQFLGVDLLPSPTELIQIYGRVRNYCKQAPFTFNSKNSSHTDAGQCLQHFGPRNELHRHRHLPWRFDHRSQLHPERGCNIRRDDDFRSAHRRYSITGLVTGTFEATRNHFSFSLPRLSSIRFSYRTSIYSLPRKIVDPICNEIISSVVTALGVWIQRNRWKLTQLHARIESAANIWTLSDGVIHVPNVIRR